MPVHPPLARAAGSAIAISLLSGGRLPLWAGVLLTAADSFALLFIERLGIRVLEGFFGAMVGVMVATFGVMYARAEVPVGEVVSGFTVPRLPRKDVPVVGTAWGVAGEGVWGRGNGNGTSWGTRWRVPHAWDGVLKYGYGGGGCEKWGGAVVAGVGGTRRVYGTFGVASPRWVAGAEKGGRAAGTGAGTQDAKRLLGSDTRA